MFYGCTSLKSVNLSDIGTSSLLSIGSMFYGCSSLESIDLSSFDTSSVSNMEEMFYGCSSLTSINLSDFYTSSSYVMDGMFYGFDSLQYLDISNFDMTNCNSYNNMFSNINTIKYINLYNFKNDKILSKTFSEINNYIYVCQRENIITKAYVCCDFNFETDECNTDIAIPDSLFGPVPVIEPDSSNSNIEFYSSNSIILEDSSDSINSVNYKKSSSSKISIGIIIGIIVGSVALIAVAIILVYCFVIKKPNPPVTTEVDSFIKEGQDFLEKQEQKKPLPKKKIPIPSKELEYLPNEQTNDKKIIINLITVSQIKIQIKIGLEKKMKELIYFYFQIIDRLDLYDNEKKEIYFMMNGEIIVHDSSKPLKDYIKDPNVIPGIVVVDQENIIDSIFEK